jgi:uncharacterized coiled-coil protein SlyX
MADLKARVGSLETRANKSEEVLQELLTSVQEIKVSLAKIDTKLTILEQELNKTKN